MIKNYIKFPPMARIHPERAEAPEARNQIDDLTRGAAFLVERGIDWISLNPDSVIATRRRIAEVESKLAGKAGED